MEWMSNVSALIAAVAALIGALAALPATLTPLIKNLTKLRNRQKGNGITARYRRLSWLADIFADERDKVSRRTTAAQLCALAACACAVFLVLLVRPDGAREHAVLAALLLALVGLLALAGATFGLDKVRVSWHNKDQRALAITAGGGAVFCLAAWIVSLFVTVALWPF